MPKSQFVYCGLWLFMLNNSTFSHEITVSWIACIPCIPLNCSPVHTCPHPHPILDLPPDPQLIISQWARTSSSAEDANVLDSQPGDTWPKSLVWCDQNLCGNDPQQPRSFLSHPLAGQNPWAMEKDQHVWSHQAKWHDSAENWVILQAAALCLKNVIELWHKSSGEWWLSGLWGIHHLFGQKVPRPHPFMPMAISRTRVMRELCFNRAVVHFGSETPKHPRQLGLKKPTRLEIRRNLLI